MAAWLAYFPPPSPSLLTWCGGESNYPVSMGGSSNVCGTRMSCRPSWLVMVSEASTPASFLSTTRSVSPACLPACTHAGTHTCTALQKAHAAHCPPADHLVGFRRVLGWNRRSCRQIVVRHKSSSHSQPTRKAHYRI